MKTLITFALCLLSADLVAQADFRPGFLVMTNGDSVRGFVGYTNSFFHERECRYRSEKDGETQVFLPANLRSYGFNGTRRFISKELPIDGQSTRVFAQLLEAGRISLLLHRDIFWIEKDSLYRLSPPKRKQIQTDDGPKMQKDNQFIGILNFLFADCPINIKRARYEVKSLTELASAYNACKGQREVVQTEDRRWTNINTQAFVGVQYSTLGSSDASSVSPVAGLGLEVSSPRIYDKVYFVFEAWYYQYLFQSYSEFAGQGFVLRTDVTTQGKSIKVPFGLRINVLPEASTLYFKFGYSFILPIDSQTTTNLEREQGGIVTTTRSTATDDQLISSGGFWGGVGYVKSIRPRLKLFGELRIDALGTTNYAIITGIRF